MPGWWHELFHAPVDPSSLALFRVLLGGLIVANATLYARDARALLDPDGMFSFGAWKNGPDRHLFSVLRWLPASRRSVTAVIAVYGAAGACLAVGWGTRWAAAAALLAGVSLNHRNRYVLHSGDALLRVMTLLMIFSDAGAVWSIDAAASRPAAAGSPWALRLMQLQLALLYLQTALYKLKGRTWRQGTASHYATRLRAHRRRRLPDWLDGVVAHRAATHGALAAELAGGTLVWFDRTRLLAIGGLVALHLSLQLLMRLHLFQWTMLASLVLFFPGETTARLVELLWS